MIAPQASIGIDPGHDVLRANQLIEAGLWLHLGGDDGGSPEPVRASPVA